MIWIELTAPLTSLGCIASICCCKRAICPRRSLTSSLKWLTKIASNATITPRSVIAGPQLSRKLLGDFGGGEPAIPAELAGAVSAGAGLIVLGFGIAPALPGSGSRNLGSSASWRFAVGSPIELALSRTHTNYPFQEQWSSERRRS